MTSCRSPGSALDPDEDAVAGAQPPLRRTPTAEATTSADRAWEHLACFSEGGLGVGIIAFGLWVYCLLDVIMTDDHRVRNLSKAVWVAVPVEVRHMRATVLDPCCWTRIRRCRNRRRDDAKRMRAGPLRARCGA